MADIKKHLAFSMPEGPRTEHLTVLNGITKAAQVQRASALAWTAYLTSDCPEGKLGTPTFLKVARATRTRQIRRVTPRLVATKGGLAAERKL